MQITVTNQKTKSIRSACSLAGSGSHGTSSATTAAPPPNRIPSSTSWTIDPLRTGPETTRRGGGLGEELADLETPATSRVQTAAFRVHGAPQRARRTDGTRTKHLADRRRSDSRLRGQRDRLGRGHPRGRLDPADRRDPRRRALDDLLVVVGGPRLLVGPASHVRRRSSPAGLLDGARARFRSGREAAPCVWEPGRPVITPAATRLRTPSRRSVRSRF